ncbi:hypothetical protein DKM05_07115 [Mycobacterium tuberculosis variant bovis]|uniref:Uncharacterized protein n=2 Tax=Mycobacterium bovis TaxID=1765 RepID=A0AB74LRK1_MYCBI|nr:hypothetical protein C1D12_10835 [Mycobacterium tuberculosis variant bovis]SIU00205.1 Probable phiRV1 phage protein [Mycobacterium tuberculosis variant bovis AF2122/97]QEF49505.1 hypothetical protein FHK93_08640 [Mycobacterium tuberculosis variant bovis]TXA04050.1 hypothetical protein DKM10_16790 [Mycobacterium tuberculosis variant bovis]TXA07613.1 hypothetical protein DKM16_16785 [Mycobacterium tuberculosis variant bovis]
MAPLAAGSPSWNGRKPSSGNRKAATMAARLDILAWGPWAQARIGASFDENRHCYRRSPRHLRRHLPAAQTNRQRNPQRVGGVGGPAPLSRGRPRLALSYLRGSLHLQNSKRVAHQHI